MIKKHGFYKTRFYRIWGAMLHRVRGQSKIWYKDIGVCKEWESFINFKNDMHRAYVRHVAKHGEKQTTIDRIDGKKGYFKENCRWATHKEQRRNTSQNRCYMFNGKSTPMIDISIATGINLHTLYARLDQHGYTPEEAFTLKRYEQRK